MDTDGVFHQNDRFSGSERLRKEPCFLLKESDGQEETDDFPNANEQFNVFQELFAFG